MKTEFEPHLVGSLQTTVHGKYNEHVDPSKLQDWCMNSIRSEVNFPSFHVRSTLNDTMLSTLHART